MRKAMLEGLCVLAHSSVMLRADTLRKAGGYRPFFYSTQDYDLWLRLADTEKLAVLPEILLRYRLHTQGVSLTRQAEQGLNHVLAVLSAQCRSLGRPDPLGTVPHTPELATALINGSDAISFLWLNILVNRPFKDKEKCLEALWLKVLPHAALAGNIGLPWLWRITRMDYPTCANAILGEALQRSEISLLPKEMLGLEIRLLKNECALCGSSGNRFFRALKGLRKFARLLKG
jgi:hypothetical protein